MKYLVLCLSIIFTLFSRTTFLSYENYEPYDVCAIEEDQIHEMTFLNQDDGIEHTISSNPFVGICLLTDADSSSKTLESTTLRMLQTISLDNISDCRSQLKKLSEIENGILTSVIKKRTQDGSLKWDSSVLRHVIEIRRIFI